MVQHNNTQAKKNFARNIPIHTHLNLCDKY